MDIGSAVGRDAGLTDEKLRALPNFETSDALTPIEKTALHYAVGMSKTPTEVPDAIFEALRADLSDAALVELTSAIAWENYRARFNRALHVEAQGFSEGAVCLLPDPPPPPTQS